MDILRKAQHLETRIARAFDRAAQRVSGSSGSEPLQPLEIVHRILEIVDSHVEPAGRGRRMFPFNRIRVTLLAVTRHERARLEAVINSQVSLHQRMVTRLRAAGCDTTDLSVAVVFAAIRTDGWMHSQFHVEFDRVAHTTRGKSATDPNGPGVELVVTRGAAEKRTYALRSARIDLGRRAEVRNDRQRLIRTNHVAFLDDQDAVNQSVSRCHAHIAYDPSASGYRIHDDGSAHGTAVLRSGRSIDVSRGSRGVRLLSGDEVLLGEARIRIRISGDR
ncbi:MAG TPA: FHA domain-containing protein [Vicinamibacterales bacterium]|nr:FHA domain-containing protein [Vicinamibacterales bacterium]